MSAEAAMEQLAELRGLLSAMAELVWRHDVRAVHFTPAQLAGVSDGRELARGIMTARGITNRSIRAARLDASIEAELLKVMPAPLAVAVQAQAVEGGR